MTHAQKLDTELSIRATSELADHSGVITERGFIEAHRSSCSLLQ